jgi:hypothetical protein
MTPRDAIRRLLAWQHDGRAHLLVFTSPQALRQQLTGAVDGWRLTDMTGLVGARPDPGYGIAINPNAPIGACLNADELTALAGPRSVLIRLIRVRMRPISSCEGSASARVQSSMSAAPSSRSRLRSRSSR